jgi:hypothetical protein
MGPITITVQKAVPVVVPTKLLEVSRRQRVGRPTGSLCGFLAVVPLLDSPISGTGVRKSSHSMGKWKIGSVLDIDM